MKALCLGIRLVLLWIPRNMIPSVMPDETGLRFNCLKDSPFFWHLSVRSSVLCCLKVIQKVAWLTEMIINKFSKFYKDSMCGKSETG